MKQRHNRSGHYYMGCPVLLVIAAIVIFIMVPMQSCAKTIQQGGDPGPLMLIALFKMVVSVALLFGGLHLFWAIVMWLYRKP